MRVLTKEERALGLERAMAARKAKADVRRRAAAGELPISRALEAPEAQGLPLGYLIASYRGIGSVRAASILESVGLDTARRVRSIGIRQREAIVSRMGRWD